MIDVSADSTIEVEKPKQSEVKSSATPDFSQLFDFQDFINGKGSTNPSVIDNVNNSVKIDLTQTNEKPWLALDSDYSDTTFSVPSTIPAVSPFVAKASSSQSVSGITTTVSIPSPIPAVTPIVTKASSSRSISCSTPIMKKSTESRRGVLFSIENLLTTDNLIFSGHRSKIRACDDVKSEAERVSWSPKCLSFSRALVDELVQLRQELILIKDENEETSSSCMKSHSSSSTELKRKSSDKVCRMCGNLGSDLYCGSCGNLKNKRGRY